MTAGGGAAEQAVICSPSACGIWDRPSRNEETRGQGFSSLTVIGRFSCSRLPFDRDSTATQLFLLLLLLLGGLAQNPLTPSAGWLAMAAAPPRSFTIRVPCTSSNIGPGFDVVGLSLSLYLTLRVTVDSSSSSTQASSSSSAPTLRYTGEGAAEAPLDAYKNLTTRTALYVLRCAGIAQFPAGVTIDVHNEVPFGRGLGSSGAAVIAGIMLGDALGNLRLPKGRLLDHALMIERHPDNVTAALIGGFVGSYLLDLSPEDTTAKDVPLSEVLPEYPPDAGQEWGKHPPAPPHGIGHYIRFGWAHEINVIAIIPQFEVSTAKARSALPDQYSKQDLVRTRCAPFIKRRSYGDYFNDDDDDDDGAELYFPLRPLLFPRCLICSASQCLPLRWHAHHPTWTSSSKPCRTACTSRTASI